MFQNGKSLNGNETTGSKFSQFFKREKTPPAASKIEDSRRSSFQDDHHHLIKNILKDITEPNVTIPGDSESYFAPISPAASSMIPPATSKPINLMELLQRSKQNTLQHDTPMHADIPPSIRNMEPGKVLSLEELEAKMLHNNAAVSKASGGIIRPPKSEEDISAFKKLLAHSGLTIPANNGSLPIPQKTQPMTIMEVRLILSARNKFRIFTFFKFHSQTFRFFLIFKNFTT